MIVELKRAGELGKKAFFNHLNRNYAIGMLKTNMGEKYFYSTCQIQSKDAYNNFKDKVEKHKKYMWNNMINDLYYATPPFLFNYVNVDRSRGIRTPHSWSREQDSESVILEKISKYMFDNRLYDCKVFIYSQKEPCLNCETVFQQFIERHPLTNLTIFYHETNYKQLPSKYNWRFK
ncbi:deaminase domain-containing protein [Virgibacillus sp. SK37]|uniref:deaminase domain-containing protein n=1 Tax=Virgibacillus sp. SK37 TaxID=403957 RepID=UPI0004D169FB|nr:deaminase domain-containing protein [Virgibacillus sp. SK37]AIF45166.1 hypothetical protein X953_03270 [Virgibacillus sp. SK37]